MLNAFAIYWLLAVMTRSIAVWAIWNWGISSAAHFDHLRFGDAVLVGLLIPALTVTVNWNREPSAEKGDEDE